MRQSEIEINFLPQAEGETKNSQEVNDNAAKHSIKIVDYLKEKVKSYNSSNKDKVNLNQLKKVFINGIHSFANIENPSFSKNEYIFARIEMFLRVKSKKDKIDFNKFSFSSVEIDISNYWAPNEKDFKLGKNDLKAFDLDYPFNDENDLYLDLENSNSRQWIEII